MIRRTVFWCVLMCLSVVALNASQLKTIVMAQQAQRTSLYLTINGSFTHKLFTLSNPSRVVIDLTGTDLAVNLNQLNLTNALIRQVRSGKPDPKTLRLVFDVSQNVQIKSSPWQPKGVALNGLRIDLLHAGASQVSFKPIPKISNLPQAKGMIRKQGKIQIKSTYQPQPLISHQTPIQVRHRPLSSLRSVVIVLDAGHGGKDPGAKGPRRSKEKDVVLAITMKLKKLIDKQPGMRAVLTRSGDYYVGLRQRLDMARKYNGDVFVSIHADAFNNPHSNGASVFALSQSGATSEAARWIAEKENYSELGGVNLGDLDDRNGVVRSVLIDLSQTATINSGLQMGSRVLSQLNNFTTLHNNKVEQARFVVLKSPDIPSILVETGFISNPREERNLTSSAYQTRLSQAIFQGIKGFFWDNPPHGTRIEAMISTRYHLVKAGETLPAIAARYHVSYAALQATNRLYGQSIMKPGQRLVIPSSWV